MSILSFYANAEMYCPECNAFVWISFDRSEVDSFDVCVVIDFNIIDGWTPGPDEQLREKERERVQQDLDTKT